MCKRRWVIRLLFLLSVVYYYFDGLEKDTTTCVGGVCERDSVEVPRVGVLRRMNEVQREDDFSTNNSGAVCNVCVRTHKYLVLQGSEFHTYVPDSLQTHVQHITQTVVPDAIPTHVQKHLAPIRKKLSLLFSMSLGLPIIFAEGLRSKPLAGLEPEGMDDPTAVASWAGPQQPWGAGPPPGSVRSQNFPGESQSARTTVNDISRGGSAAVGTRTAAVGRGGVSASSSSMMNSARGSVGSIPNGPQDKMAEIRAANQMRAIETKQKQIAENALERALEERGLDRHGKPHELPPSIKAANDLLRQQQMLLQQRQYQGYTQMMYGAQPMMYSGQAMQQQPGMVIGPDGQPMQQPTVGPDGQPLSPDGAAIPEESDNSLPLVVIAGIGVSVLLLLVTCCGICVCCMVRKKGNASKSNSKKHKGRRHSGPPAGFADPYATAGTGYYTGGTGGVPNAVVTQQHPAMGDYYSGMQQQSVGGGMQQQSVGGGMQHGQVQEYAVIGYVPTQ
eukprot:Lankesteria_metandrocarpae@DN4542_c0_g1_i1.p1